MMKKIFRKIYSTIFLAKTVLRSLYWKMLFNEEAGGVSGTVRINGRIAVIKPENVYVGKYTTINEGVVLNASEYITIGSYVRISPRVVIMTTGLKIKESKIESHESLPITIGDRAWIGTGAIILPGIKIGESSVVAAGSVVTKDVPPKTLVAGVPAEIKKTL